MYRLMEDYHSQARVNGSGRWVALKSAIGLGAVLACFALSVGGVEIAQADSPQAEVDRFIRLDGEPVGTAVPAKEVPAKAVQCSADSQQARARGLDNLQRLVRRTARDASLRANGAEGGEELPVALNAQGYNYGATVPMRYRGQ